MVMPLILKTVIQVINTSSSSLSIDFIMIESAFTDYLKNTPICATVYEELMKEETVVSQVISLLSFSYSLVIQIKYTCY